VQLADYEVVGVIGRIGNYRELNVVVVSKPMTADMSFLGKSNWQVMMAVVLQWCSQGDIDPMALIFYKKQQSKWLWQP